MNVNHFFILSSNLKKIHNHIYIQYQYLIKKISMENIFVNNLIEIKIIILE